MILGNSEKFKGKGHVCFIDVLGFSNDILDRWHALESNPLEKILSIKNRMPIFRDVDKDTGGSSHRQYVCRVQTISDSVTICFGYGHKIIVGDLVLGLEALLANLSYIWSTFIGEGYTIRGAIDFGDIYWDKNELIGPAFINAYRLESDVAKNSRVVLSSGLNRELRNLFDNHESGLTEHLRRNFRRDVDGYIVFDPNVMYRSDEERRFLIRELSSMKTKVESKVVKEKYTQVLSMLSDGVTEDLKAADFGNY